jgi:hypothetical protein
MSKTEKPGEEGKAKSMVASSHPARDSRPFASLSLQEQKDRVRRADASTRYRLILDVADGRALVQSLTSQDLFLTIKELGRDEVPELVAMASGEQLTAFVDLDCWRKDQIDAPEALHWLALAMTEGEDKVLEAAQSLDFELLVLIMRQFVQVLRGAQAFHDEDNPADYSKCIGAYELEMLQPKYALLVTSMLDCLYRLDQSFFTHLMEVLRWELPSCLEENSFQSHCDRLQDLGFPDPSQVGEIYAWVDPDTFDVDQYRRYPGMVEAEPAPGFVLSVVRARDLLAEVLAAGLNDACGWDLTYLANKVLVADGIDFGDRVQLQAAMDKVYGYLNLALEHLCQSDEQRATQLFGDTYLLPLFRLGYSLTLQLQRQARRLRASSVGPWLDGIWAECLEILAMGQPLCPGVLDDPSGEGGRPFRNMADVRRVKELLATADATRRLFEEHFPFHLPTPDDLDLGGCQPEQTQAVGLRHFFLTALANRLQGRAFDATPLPVAELAALHGRVCRDKALAEALREETRTWLQTLEPAAWPFAEACLQCWDDTLCPLRADMLDPRFVDGLLIRTA